MTPSFKTTFSQHPKDLLPIYIDGELAEKDRVAVENHLDQCLECSEELEALKQVVDVLKTDKSVFCPEAWELYEFIETGEDPEGKLVQHLEDCPLCCADVAEYRETAIQKTLPSEIKTELKGSFLKPAQRQISNESKIFAWAKGWLTSIFKMPTLTLATAVAAILAVVLLYPHGSSPVFIGVSSENWEEASFSATAKSLVSDAHEREEIAKPVRPTIREASKPRLSAAPKPRVAPIVLFHGFEKPLPQSTVDSLYEQLRPSEELEERFQFSTPADLKQFLDKVADRHLPPAQELSEFYKESSINFALIENVKAEKDKFGLKSQLIETRNGKILAESIESRLSETDLASRVNDSLILLNSVKTESRAK